MVQFYPGSEHTAIVPVINPTEWAWDYVALLSLGGNPVALAAFHLEPGESVEISYPVTMPSIEGVWPVTLDLLCEGYLILHYTGEDVSIVAVGEPSFWMDPHLYYIGGEGACTYYDLYAPHFKARIENRGTGPGTFELMASYSGSVGGWPRSWSWPGWPAPARPGQNMNPCYLTLGPGEAIDYEIVGVGFDCYAGQSWNLTFMLSGAWAGNNVASGQFYGPAFPPIETYPY